MNSEGKSIVIYVIIGVILLKIAILWTEYFQFKMNLNNPLIPQSLSVWKFNYSLFLTLTKGTALLLCVYYLLAKRFFLPILIFSLAVLVAEVLFMIQIHKMFMP